MMIPWELSLTELLSASLYLLTAVLLAYAVNQRYLLSGRLCAMGAILSVVGANVFFVGSYNGEPEVIYERPGPIKRAKAGERGVFQFEDEEAGGAGSGGSGSGSSGSVTMASSDSAAAAKAERQIMHGLGCTDCPDMVVLRPGVFRMGADDADAAARPSERPTRMIGIGAPFAIGRNEVTVGEYMAFVRATGRQPPACPASARADNPRHPITCVSPRDADAYAAWLSVRTGGIAFRLPSEAEWEYAARAGASGPYANGDQLSPGDANVGRADAIVVPVGSFRANGFGLNDMHGNAAEIVAGCWVATPADLPGDGTAAPAALTCGKRVLRDGHAGEPASHARLSARRPIGKAANLRGVGFRLARDLK